MMFSLVKSSRRIPFTLYGCLGLAMYGLKYALKPQYDEGWLGLILVLGEPFWGFPYVFAYHLIASEPLGNDPVPKVVMTFILGIGLCIFCDY